MKLNTKSNLLTIAVLTLTLLGFASPGKAHSTTMNKAVDPTEINRILGLLFQEVLNSQDDPNYDAKNSYIAFNPGENARYSLNFPEPGGRDAFGLFWKVAFHRTPWSARIPHYQGKNQIQAFLRVHAEKKPTDGAEDPLAWLNVHLETRVNTNALAFLAYQGWKAAKQMEKAHPNGIPERLQLVHGALRAMSGVEPVANKAENLWMMKHFFKTFFTELTYYIQNYGDEGYRRLLPLLETLKVKEILNNNKFTGFEIIASPEKLTEAFGPLGGLFGLRSMAIRSLAMRVAHNEVRLRTNLLFAEPEPGFYERNVHVEVKEFLKAIENHSEDPDIRGQITEMLESLVTTMHKLLFEELG